MGCVSSSLKFHLNDDDQTFNSRLIDNELKKSGDYNKSIIKLLLLGAGEGGKSTILKQMKIIHDDGFSKEEKAAVIPIIYQSLFNSMKIALEGYEFIGLGDEAVRYQNIVDKTAEEFEDPLRGVVLRQDQSESLKFLWKIKQVQSLILNNSKVPEAIGYFFRHLDRILTPDYQPDKDDLLHVRIRTTGIVEFPFKVKYEVSKGHESTLRMIMIDVGGQRSERRKWINCFENVNAVLFVVGISEYNQTLFEDDRTNRLVESLNLFTNIVNNHYFEKSGFILFLNKIDIFVEKIKNTPLSDCFPDYNGECGDLENAKQFIANKFLSKNKNNKLVYHHFTCATDTHNIKIIFKDIVDIIIKKALEKYKLE